MWQGRQNSRATQKESLAKNKQMTAVRYISDTEENVKASWSHFQHIGAAAFKLPERSQLPPAMLAKELPGCRTQLWNARLIRKIDSHSAERDENSAPDNISDTENWPNWKAGLVLGGCYNLSKRTS